MNTCIGCEPMLFGPLTRPSATLSPRERAVPWRALAHRERVADSQRADGRVRAVLSALVIAAGIQNPVHDTVPALTAIATSERIVIDGHLTEAAWAAAVPVSGFRQHDPDEGLPATERTNIRILHD